MTPKRLKINAGLHWVHWLVVSSSLLLTLLAWHISKTQTEEKLQLRFDFQARQLIDLVSERMSRYEDALRSGVATIHAQNHDINVAEWQRLAQTLHIEKRYPGINGIGVIHYVPPKKLQQYLARERQLRPDYAIHPAHEQNEHWPISYVEPVAANKKAIGLDMAFEINRFTAAKKARDSNSTQITAPIVLVQDAKKTPGFLQFVPFYKSKELGSLEQRQNQFIGHVYAPFIMYKLMEGTLSQKNRKVVFSVRDGKDVLYDELSSDNPHYDRKPLFHSKTTIEMYGRPWEFDISTAKSFRHGAAVHQSSFILIAGIIIDTLLLFLFVALSRSQSRGVELSKKISISEVYFRHIIEAAPCGILIVNEAGLIETLNPHALALLEYRENELLNKPVECLVPVNVRNNHHAYRHQFWKNPEQRRMGLGRDVHCLTKNGELFPAEIGLAQFGGEDGLKVLITIIDMTTHENITNELKRSNKELNDFAYVASHDLKAPLRGISQLASWIEEDIQDVASQDTKQNLALLQNRTARLEKLLDDLLTYSRIGRNQGEKQRVDILALLSTVFELQNPPQGYKLVCEGTMPVFDTLAAPLDVIFRNLIGNAIKHGDKQNGIITISVTENTHHYEFSVCDDGPGIDPQYHKRAFELFKTLKPRDVVEGSGMGLSIIQKMLETHRCTIRIESDGKSGTCVIFTWPKVISTGNE